MRIGITSYYPDDPQNRQARKKAHAHQIAWLRKLYPDEEITVVAQNYHDDDYIDGIRYISYPAGIGASAARNVLLKEFYASKDKWLLMLDDDCILYDYYDGYKLLQELDTTDKFKGIHAITANNPKYLPFKKDNYADKRIQTHWKFIKRPFNTAAQFAVYANVKTMLFDESNDVTVNMTSEDVDFHIRWVRKGLTSYICSQWQLKDMSGENSTYWSDDRVEKEKLCVRNMLKKLGLDIVKNDKIRWTELDKYNRTQKVGYIKREQPCAYKENEIPK